MEDAYIWLEDDNSRVSKWVSEKNVEARAFLDAIPQRKKIHKEFTSIFSADDLSSLRKRGNIYFFTLRKGDEEFPSLYMQEGFQGKPELLFNGNSSLGFLSPYRWDVSPKGRYVFVNLSKNSNDKCALYILDLKTKKIEEEVPDLVYPSVYSSVQWNTQETGFWYTRHTFPVILGEEKFHHSLYFHLLGSDWKDDMMLFTPEKKEEIIECSVFNHGKDVFVTVFNFVEKQAYSDIYYRVGDLWVPVIKDKEALFFPRAFHDTLYVLSNEGGKNSKIISASLLSCAEGKALWSEIIPDGAYPLTGWQITEGGLYVVFLKDLHNVLQKFTFTGSFVEEILLPGTGLVEFFSSEEGKPGFSILFSSYLQPASFYFFDENKKEFQLFYKSSLQLDEKEFTVEMKWYTSKDETKIPLFLLHKKGISLDSKNFVLLSAYGGFGINAAHYFESFYLPLVKDGGVFAFACIRGGGEFGEVWHKASMREKKQNGFDDFIAAASYLIEKKYCSAERLAIKGWSNGGLLVGTVSMQRPELFKAVVCGAPVLDLMRFHLFNGGKLWMDEYGNPDDPKMREYMLSYSPYHNIPQEKNLPALLFVTAVQDDRVHPMHAYKMVAKLKGLYPEKKDILLLVESNAGHGGAASRSRAIEQNTDMLSFLYKELEFF
ncbi:MAG: prolyl oligopeptidase family serine peptidase [bacterium]|nr:prolyl oligopeptidase family serine peptidase [bacterium]